MKQIIVIQVPGYTYCKKSFFTPVTSLWIRQMDNTYLAGILLRVSSGLEFAEGKRRLEMIPHCKIILLIRFWCLILFDFLVEVV